MRISAIIILLFFLITQISQAQKKYSIENLGKASQEELDVYLNKAIKLQKTGRTFNIIGGASLGVVGVAAIWGGPLGVDSWTLIGISVGGLMVGVTSLAIGIPTNLTGKNRVERINSIKRTTFLDTKIDLRPCVQYNFVSENYQPVIAFQISF